MRRDKKLGEDIIVALWNHKDPHLSFSEIRQEVSPSNEHEDGTIQHHLDLLEDVGLVVTGPTGLIRLTSTGHDRAENTDKPDSMDTWRILGS